ncbi:MAG: SDR family oxidoreductase [Promicromonosporaceae bacterium]|nr:SDR family oxidoreductase [Promicromonosporaceae bacterium]
MKIAVIGGTGLIGSQVVRILNDEGHEAVAHALTTGVDLLTGEGVAAALEGADVVVNLTNSPTFDEASPAFFQTSMDNLLAAAAAAGVGHAVILSIVGAEKVPDFVYYTAKVLQEDVLKAGPVPYSIVRSTQFDEFIHQLIKQAAGQDPVRLTPTTLQPITSADIARAVADVAAGAPLNGTRNVAGPEVVTLDELGRITLAAQGDERPVAADDEAGMFAAMKGDVLIPGEGDDAVIAKTTYREWLASQAS